MKLPN